MIIKRWDTKEVIFELECSSWEELLKGALKAKISFYRADFSYSNFSYSNFSDSDFRGSNFRGSNFGYSDFRGSNFRGSNFRGSNFRGSNFRGSDFSDSDFSDSDFGDSDFRGSNFRGSNFRGSNFSDSKHQYKIGNMREWKSMQLDTYMIVFNEHTLAIGCQQHTIKEWQEFTDDTISKMDTNALLWWTKWKELIFKAIELSNTKG
ncbi:MAG: pentapeptide repeat-containing protein [Sulfurimonas denitrificans]|nr:pentapeptide repeat-containing protein [Sulfurimonas denitrificans]